MINELMTLQFLRFVYDFEYIKYNYSNKNKGKI